MINSYQKMILADTGCSPEDAAKIECIMREDVVHSTLDWLSRAEFRDGAHKAACLLSANRSTYEESFAAARAVFEQMKHAAGTTLNAGTQNV